MTTNHYHVGIFHHSLVNFIFSGKKTIESRFSSKRIAPFQKVSPNDVVFIKPVSKPIMGFFTVKRVKYFELSDTTTIMAIKSRYNSRILASDDFWHQKKAARYATLIWIETPTQLKKPLFFPKKDRRGWIVLKQLPEKDDWRELIQELAKMTRSRQSNPLKKKPAK